MQLEYVTDAVLPGLFRCPNCGSKVRQIRQELPAHEGFAVALGGEPLACVVVGIGAVVGLIAQAVMALLLAWVVLGLPALVWLYLSHLRRSSFLCSACGAQSSYIQARKPVVVQTPPSDGRRR